MPIYDSNGTTIYQIGKVYDNNGSANTQIGKIYDSNGAVNSLIYSAETVLTGGTVKWDCQNKTSSSYAWTICTWDLSGCNTVTFTYTDNTNLYYWTSPKGTCSHSSWLRFSFADGTLSSTLASGDKSSVSITVDLSSYTDVQKASVTVQGCVSWSLSTWTNIAATGGFTIADGGIAQ